MPGPARTPTNILKLRGSDKKHPERIKARENEPVNTQPIGDPPDWLSDPEKEAWQIIVDECIDGVLGKADRIAVACASQLLAVSVAGLAAHQEKVLLHRYLGQFGMLPGDRSKISIAKKKPKNEFDD